MSSILIVDDDELLLEAIADSLGSHGYQLSLATTGEQGLEKLATDPPDVVLLDYRLPRIDGFAVLRKIKETRPEVAVIIMTTYASVAAAVEAMQLGAYDYVTKPINLEELCLVVNRAVESLQRSHELDYLRSRVNPRGSSHEIIGESEAIQHVRTLIDQIVSISSSGRSIPGVLITGETGTGKGLVARLLHNKGSRAQGPFVEINCAAIPLTLLEAELFGYEKGAFTDAKSQKIGLFEAANTGTLFLDEVASMDLNLQAKLLKAIEEKSIRRLGGIRDRAIDVTVVAATNRPLEQAIEERVFRHDLYYRLNVLKVDLPPLRERGDDAVILAQQFLKLHTEQYARREKELTEPALKAIASYDWPGNVRELSNVIERAVLLKAGRMIDTDDLGLSTAAVQLGVASGDADLLSIDLSTGVVLDEIERNIIEHMLLRTGWNRTRAAALLGLSRETLRYRIEKHKLHQDGSKDEPIK